MMVMYMCPKCDKALSGGEKHDCKPKPVPFNVIMTDEDKAKLDHSARQKQEEAFYEEHSPKSSDFI